MKVLGDAVQLEAATTLAKTAAAVHVTNTTAGTLEVIVRDTADNADEGSVYLAAKGQVEITLGSGRGLRGVTGIYATPIAKSGI